VRRLRAGIKIQGFSEEREDSKIQRFKDSKLVC
jgi:hypothetical protein